MTVLTEQRYERYTADSRNNKDKSEVGVVYCQQYYNNQYCITAGSSNSKDNTEVQVVYW